MVVCLALGAGCAEVTRSVGPDLNPGNPDDLAVTGIDAAEDLSIEEPDLTIACDMGAGFRICGGKCVAPDGCCASNECPTPSNGAPLCNTLNRCDVACNSGYKACNGSCIPTGDCCSDGDCTTPGDNCKLVSGAMCKSGTCNYPPVSCPYTGQFCDPGTGNCVCPGGQHPCVTVVAGKPQGSCIGDSTCCTNNDCSSIAGQVCPAVGGNCTCTAGFKKCSVSSSCILTTQCCDNTDCTVAGQMCSGAGGSCTCPSMQKECGATCIPIAKCCIDAECNALVTGEICNTGTCQCPTGKRVCSNSGTNICITSGTCCIDSDCPLTGEKCSGIGGSCACVGTDYACGGACIHASQCCSNGNCTVSGQTCVGGPPGNCQCPGGTAVCNNNNKCVSTASGSCCTVADCPTGPSSGTHVGSASCSAANLCSVTGCQGIFYDVDRVWSNGCECQDDTAGGSCGARTAVGPIGIGGGQSISGKLPFAGAEDWFAITYTGSTSGTDYHPHVTISSGTDDIRFDVRNGTACNPPALGCGEGGSASNLKQWEYYTYYDGNSFGWDAPAAVGNGGLVYVRVFRFSGGVTCNNYILNVTNY